MERRLGAGAPRARGEPGALAPGGLGLPRRYGLRGGAADVLFGGGRVRREGESKLEGNFCASSGEKFVAMDPPFSVAFHVSHHLFMLFELGLRKTRNSRSGRVGPLAVFKSMEAIYRWAQELQSGSM